ncbi:MAG: type VI secretion system baseplate subunit TssG [Acidobacteria bacterium]|nr:type VI secretion system baseplate subunit TssG [Acidobacteriota bacterium]
MYKASHLFQEIRRLKRKAADDGKHLRIEQRASRVFEPAVVACEHVTEKTMTATINFEGLYGGLGVLPGYFSDEILHHRDGLNALQDFLDLFNHRMFDSLYTIWRRSQIFLENGVDAKHPENEEMDQFLCALAGIPGDDHAPLYIKCLRRHHFTLFQRKEKTVLGLANVLRSFFGDLSFEFEQHQERYIPIPVFQRSKLGEQLTLGASGTFLIGSRIRDINGRFNIKVAQLDYAGYMRFLPGGDWHELMGGIVRAYTQDQWACGLSLELRAAEVPSLKLGAHRLSADCWALSQPSTEPALVRLGGSL